MKNNLFSLFLQSTQAGNNPPTASVSTLNASYTYADVDGDLENNALPTATNLVTTGDHIVGQTLTASYDFFSPSGYAEGASIVRWYSANPDEEDGILIATGLTYTLLSAEASKEVYWEVSPVQTASSPANGNPTGGTVRSVSVLVTDVPGTIEFVGISVFPANAGSQGIGTITLTPVAGLASGDQVVVILQNRSQLNTFGNSVTGGQTWSSSSIYLGTNQSIQIWRCIFNGTWAASPQFDIVGVAAGAFSAQMFGFSPTPGRSFTFDAYDAGVFSGGSSPAVRTLPSVGVANVGTVVLYGWFTGVANTYSNLAGTDWVEAGISGYTNLSGSDQSASFAYTFRYAAAATAPVSKELNLNTAGAYVRISFYES